MIKNYFNISLLSLFFLNSCSTPTVPTQPLYGSTSRYFATKNYNLRSNSSLIQNVPFFKQGDDNTCGQASMSAVLNFWGVKITYQKVVNDTNKNNMATDLNTISKYLKEKGLNAEAYNNANIEYVKELVDKGRPAIVLLDFGGLSNEHYVVVTGYNNSKGTIIFNDSKRGTNISISEENFEKLWENKSLTSIPIFGSKYYKPVFNVWSE